MSLKSTLPADLKEKLQTSMLMPLESTLIKGEVLDKSSKVPCWCTGRHGKEHIVGDPFCHFPGTYTPPSRQIESKTGTISSSNLQTTSQIINLTKSAPTFDEDLIMSCINRAIAKTPRDFVPLLDEGRCDYVMARHINNELRLSGYCISEEPF